MTASVVTSPGILKPMLRLALPVFLEQLLIVLVGFVDLWLTGNFLQESHLAAIGLMGYVLWLIPCMFSLVAIGATALTARFVGAGDLRSARQVLHQSMILGGALALAVTLLLASGGGSFVRVVQLGEDAAPLAARYLWLLLPGVPFIMVEQIANGCLRGAGDTVSGLVAMTVVNVVNIALGVGLVTGWGPFPSLGWEGLPIATTCGYVVGGAILSALLLRGRAGLKLRRKLMRPNVDIMRRVLRIGVPGGVDSIAVVCCHLWFISIVYSLGTLAAAAHGLGVRLESISYLPGAAFQVAAATMAGQHLGARRPDRAVRSVVVASVLCCVMLSGCGLLFFFQGRWLTSLFLASQTQETATLTVPLLKVLAITQPALALMMVLGGGMRGAGDTRWPLAFTFVGFLMIRIPGAYWLAFDEIVVPFSTLAIQGWGLGVMGAWYAMAVDIFVRATLITGRFLHGGWKEIPV